MTKISKINIAEALKGIRHLKIKRNKLPVIQNVLVRSTGDEVRMVATNLDECLEYRCPVENGASFEALIPIDTLTQAVRQTDKNAVVEIHPNRMVYPVKGVEFQVEIPEPPEEEGKEFPPIPQTGTKSARLDPETLTGISEAMGYASTDPTRYILNGVCITPGDIAATDGRRLYHQNGRALSVPKDGVVVPVTSAWKLIDTSTPATLLFDKDVEPRNLTLRQGPWSYSTMLLDGTYPNWKQVMPKSEELESQLIISNEDAELLIKTIPLLPLNDWENHPVFITADNGDARVTVHPAKESGGIPLKGSRWVGGDITIACNREFLLQALSLGFRELQLKNEHAPLLMVDRERGRESLAMPLNPKIKENITVSEATFIYKEVPQEKGRERKTTSAPVDSRANGGNGKSTTAAKRSGNGNGKPKDQKDAGGSGNGNGPGSNGNGRSMEEPDWEEGMASLTELRDVLTNALSALSTSQTLFRKLQRQQRRVEKENDQIRRSIRSIQKIEV